jgi:AcrR family transcriptional regulator
MDGRLEKGERRKAAIIGAARRLFSERGFDGVSAQDVADAAGVPKSLVYHYFTGMEELFANIVDTTPFFLPRGEDEAEGTSAAADAGNHVDRILEAMENDRDGLRIFLGEALRRDAVLDSLMDGLKKISEDFDRIAPVSAGFPGAGDLGKKELSFLRVYARFLPLILFTATGHAAAKRFGLSNARARELLLSAMKPRPRGKA